MNDKKKVFISIIFLLLVGSVSATDLSFTTFFPECGDSTRDSFESSIRCGAYFLVPNFHWEAGKKLLIDNIINSVYSIGNVIVDIMYSPIKELQSKDLSSIGVVDYIKATILTVVYLFGLFFGGSVLIALGLFLYAILSSVVAFCLLITFEFIKTYLLISLMWLLWSEVLFHESKSFPLSFKQSAILIAGLMVAGSIVLLAANVTIWGGI